MLLPRLRTATILALASLALLSPIDALAGTGGRPSATRVLRTNATTTVDRDNRAASNFDFDVLSTTATHVTADNSALATTSCSDCRAVSISFQIVTASGSGIDLTANNSASAVNTTCSGCESLAIAYQFILVTARPVTLNPDVDDRLRQIQRDLKRLSRSTSAIADIEPRVLLYVNEIITIAEDLVESSPTTTDTRGKRQPRVTVHHHSRLRQPDH